MLNAPMQEEPICDECLMAFWERLFGAPEPLTAHQRHMGQKS
jgi:hypothetical protein